MLVNSNSILANASKEGYAVPAYNINNLEWARFVLEACNDDKSPVILAFTEGVIGYLGGYKVVYSMVKALICELDIKVPVVLHLDHGKSFDSCKKAIDAGFTSVMIDGAELPFDENVDLTNKVIEYANKNDVSVEGEIGELQTSLKVKYTEFEDASLFCQRTCVNSLALSVGNKHGVYLEEPKLDFELLGAVCKEVKIPLVLHGGSFIDENKIKTAIFCGVSKININTELQCAWTNAVRKFLNYDEKIYDPRIIIKSGESEIKKVIHEKNKLFGSKNKAN